MSEVRYLQNAVDYAEEHITEKLDYADLSKAASMSLYQFQRLFSIVCGMSVGEYIRNRRLSMAASALAETNLSVLDIALKFGYDTPDGFSRAFLRRYGLTPSLARAKKAEIAPFHKLVVSDLHRGGYDNVEKLLDRGYTVMENGALYFTQNMDKTAEWFENVLGWYAGIDSRDADGNGLYGCVTPVPGELINAKIVEFHGFHLFMGEPAKRRTGFVLVRGIDALRAYVLNAGWNKVTEIVEQPWGSRLMTVTTVDESEITFFEINE